MGPHPFPAELRCQNLSKNISFEVIGIDRASLRSSASGLCLPLYDFQLQSRPRTLKVKAKSGEGCVRALGLRRRRFQSYDVMLNLIKDSNPHWHGDHLGHKIRSEQDPCDWVVAQGRTPSARHIIGTLLNRARLATLWLLQSKFEGLPTTPSFGNRYCIIALCSRHLFR